MFIYIHTQLSISHRHTQSTLFSSSFIFLRLWMRHCHFGLLLLSPLISLFLSSLFSFDRWSSSMVTILSPPCGLYLSIFERKKEKDSGHGGSTNERFDVDSLANDCTQKMFWFEPWLSLYPSLDYWSFSLHSAWSLLHCHDLVFDRSINNERTETEAIGNNVDEESLISSLSLDHWICLIITRHDRMSLLKVKLTSIK